MRNLDEFTLDSEYGLFLMDQDVKNERRVLEKE